jgi:adenylyl cyclase-associated protein
MEATRPLEQFLEKLSIRLSAVEAKLSISPSKSVFDEPSPASDVSVNTAKLAPQILAYDEYTTSNLQPFLLASKKLGREVSKLGDLVEKAFDAQRNYLLMASHCKKPSAPNPEHLKSLQECLQEVNSLRDNRSEYANHQNMISEGIQSLGWLCVEPAPKPFIESYIGGADFWGNKIRVQYKTSSPDQVGFVASFKNLLINLIGYVKEHHTTGVTWNPSGIDSGTYISPPESATTTGPQKELPSSGGGMTTVFASIKGIDQSEGKTPGLRKVTKDMQTWRPEYKEATEKPKPSDVTIKAGQKQASYVPKPIKKPVCEQRNANWFIENQVGGAPISIKDVHIKQQVYIYGCTDATILLEGKAKNIVFDSCEKSRLIFDDAVSSIEVVNCKNVRIQCKGQVPSISIDKTDGCLVYVSWEGRDAQFVTSKSSEMNVAFPQASGSDEYVEKPIPEQFVHTITSGNSISSNVSDLYSH